MKAKLFTLFLASSMLFSLVGCGGGTSSEAESSAQSESVVTEETAASTAEEMLTLIKEDFAAAISSLEESNESALESIGDSYDGYVANEQLLSDWYDEVNSVSQTLFANTEENAWTYFILAAEEYNGDDDEMDDALDDFYDDIYNGVMDDYYDDIYCDLFDNIYDDVYCDIFDDAYDEVDRAEWRTAYTNCYNAWSDAYSITYKNWSNAYSELYNIWSAVYSGIYDDNYDIAAIRAAYETRKSENAERAESIVIDFSETIAALKESQTELFDSVGDTYEEYVSNKQLVSDWCESLETETTALFERTVENAWGYFQDAASAYENDYDAMSDAVSYFYDSIYDDAMDDYYDAIYDDLMDSLYEQYYDGIISDAYDDFSYSEVLDERSEAYELYLNTRSSIYDNILDAKSELYDICDAVRSAIWDDNYDIDAVRSSYEAESADSSESENAESSDSSESENAESSGSSESEESKTSSASPETDESTAENTESEELVDGMRPEIKQAIDDYEAFFDEYCDFLVTYSESDDPTTLLTQYAEFMAQYATTMASFEAMADEDLNDAELLYYTEASARITQELLEVSASLNS